MGMGVSGLNESAGMLLKKVFGDFSFTALLVVAQAGSVLVWG
jgi:hypothetical protein